MRLVTALSKSEGSRTAARAMRTPKRASGLVKHAQVLVPRTGDNQDADVPGGRRYRPQQLETLHV
jgi:hypothetical protein